MDCIDSEEYFDTCQDFISFLAVNPFVRFSTMSTAATAAAAAFAATTTNTTAAAAAFV